MELREQLELNGESRDVPAHRQIGMVTARESMPILRQWDRLRLLEEEAIVWAFWTELGLVASCLAETVTC